MMNFKEQSRNAFDKQAETYDIDKNGKHARSIYSYIIDKLSDMQFSNVLDVGCGTGEILNTIKTLYPAVSLFGIDISKEMLKQAEEKGLNNSRLFLGDAECLPFENEKFDLLICTDSFHHYPNPQRALDEFYRVLRKGGILLLADFWKPFPIRQLMNLFIPYSNEGDVKIYSKTEIINFLEQSCFKNIQYRKVNKSSYSVLAKS